MKKALLFLLVLSVCPALFAQQKHALVIGNANYTGISSLRNPVNDANDMETALRGLGFTVEKVLNGNLIQMETAIQNLKRRLDGSRNSYGFFFYAGHGVQSNGENYLIPVDASTILSEGHLRQRAVSLQTLLDNLSEAGNELNIVVLDACRDNPFGWNRSGLRGLSVVSRAPTGTIVMYAAGAGQAASDGTGRNGLFTGQLLNSLRTPGLNVLEVFSRTGDEVIKVSDGRQHPEISVRFFGTVFLSPRPAPPEPAPQTAQPAPADTTQPPPQVTPTPQPAPQPAPAVTTPTAVPQRPAGMVRIPGGSFQMGSVSGLDIERPVRRVAINAFSISRYPVTQKEWQEVMGTNPSHFKGDNFPVESVSWFDAIEYCNRRSQREGLTPAYTVRGTGDNRTVRWNRRANGYRLPTEAEWEYAARGGNGSPGNFTYSGSNNVDEVAWHSGNSGGRTHIVGAKKPNALGLYDMNGNVREWCWDWFETYLSREQTDPTGPSSGTYRVIRGGGWSFSAGSARSTYRISYYPYNRSSDVGFRIVRP